MDEESIPGLMQSAEAMAAVATRSGTEVSMPLEQILRGLNSNRYDVWNEARHAARHLATTSPDGLLLLTRMEARAYRKRTGIGTIVSLSLVAICFVWFFSLMAPGALFTLAAVSLACATWLSIYIPRRARRSLLDVLRNMDDPRFLGPVLTMLVPDGVTEVKTSLTLNGYVRKTITAVLMDMLPRVRQEHRANLSRAHMQTLLALLWQSRSGAQLTVRILRALQHIGDESAIPYLEKLVESPNLPVQEEAIECLDYLRLHAGDRRQGEMLLRASDNASTVSPETLLRPVLPGSGIGSGTGGALASKQLLRSAECSKNSGFE